MFFFSFFSPHFIELIYSNNHIIIFQADVNVPVAQEEKGVKAYAENEEQRDKHVEADKDKHDDADSDTGTIKQ